MHTFYIHKLTIKKILKHKISLLKMYIMLYKIHRLIFSCILTEVGQVVIKLITLYGI